MIYIRDWLLLIAAGLSNLLLIDALYKLRKVVKGVFAVDTWQMILHVSAYTLVFINGIIMLGLAYNAKKKFKGLSYASTSFYSGIQRIHNFNFHLATSFQLHHLSTDRLISHC